MKTFVYLCLCAFAFSITTSVFAEKSDSAPIDNAMKKIGSFKEWEKIFIANVSEKDRRDSMRNYFNTHILSDRELNEICARFYYSYNYLAILLECYPYVNLEDKTLFNIFTNYSTYDVSFEHIMDLLEKNGFDFNSYISDDNFFKTNMNQHLDKYKTPLMYTFRYSTHYMNKDILERLDILTKKGADINFHKPGYLNTLYYLCFEQNYPSAKYAIEKLGANVNCSDSIRGISCLNAVIYYKNDTIFNLLLEHGADPNLQSIEGNTPFINAIRCNNLDYTKRLLERGGDLNHKDNHGRTVIMYAVHKNKDFYDLLGGAPKDTAIYDNLGVPLFQHAVMCAHVDIVQDMLERGYDINQLDSAGEIYPIDRLMRCCCKLCGHTESNHKQHNSRKHKMLDFLLNYKVKPVVTLRTAANALDEKLPNVYNYYIKNATDLNAVDSAGHRLIYYAIKYKNIDMVRSLLDKGVDTQPISTRIVNMWFDKEAEESCRKRGYTNKQIEKQKYSKVVESLMNTAVESGDLAMVKLLHEKGVSLRKKSDGEPPVIRACRLKDADILKYFAANGFDLLKIRYKKLRLSRYVLSMYAEPQYQIIKYLHELGEDFTKVDKEEGGYLDQFICHRSFSTTDSDIYKFLISVKAPQPDFCVFVRSNVYFYNEESKQSRLKQFQFLLDHGANINDTPRNQYDLTPLMTVVSRCDEKMIQWFLDRGADPTQTIQRNRKTISVLDCVSNRQDIKSRPVVKAMIEKAIKDWNAKNTQQ